MITESISDLLELTAKLMELHSENPFKIKAISSAAYRISKMNMDLSGKTIEELECMEGIGKGIAAKINELNLTGTTTELQSLLNKTPEGVLDVLKVKGLGPKKVAQLWKELQIESVGELLYACNENRLIKLKGFGVKSQEEIKKSVEFLFANKDKYHYAYAAFFANEFIQLIKQLFPDALISFTGELHRKAEVVSVFDLLIEERYSDKVMEWSNHQAYPFQIHGAPTHQFSYHSISFLTAKKSILRRRRVS